MLMVLAGGGGGGTTSPLLLIPFVHNNKYCGITTTTAAPTPTTNKQLPSEEENDASSFFSSLDQDHDGDVDTDELEKLITEVNDPAFDDSEEIAQGILSTFTKMDDDKDKQLQAQDLLKHWVSLATLMTPRRTRDWLTHAVGLDPLVAEAFYNKRITGLMLPSLLDMDKLNALLTDLNIGTFVSKTDKTKLIGAIKLRMMAVGDTPHAPELHVTTSQRCGVVVLTWGGGGGTLGRKKVFPEVHEFRLFRREARDNPAHGEDEWRLIYAGLAMAFTDRGLVPTVATVAYDYKIEAWNLVGVSESSEVHDITPSKDGCEMSWTWLDLLYWLASNAFVFQSVQLAMLACAGLYLSRNWNDRDKMVGRRRRQLMPSHTSDGGGGSTNGTSTNGNGGGGIPSSSTPLSFDGNGGNSLATFNHRAFLGGRQESDPNLLLFGMSAASDSALITTAAAAAAAAREEDFVTGPDKCAFCKCKVTRHTRHVCGGCGRVFCITHTAYAPHKDVKTPLFGAVILSSCGINSKCRCVDCYEPPTRLRTEPSGSVVEEPVPPPRKKASSTSVLVMAALGPSKRKTSNRPASLSVATASGGSSGSGVDGHATDPSPRLSSSDDENTHNLVVGDATTTSVPASSVGSRDGTTSTTVKKSAWSSFKLRSKSISGGAKT